MWPALLLGTSDQTVPDDVGVNILHELTQLCGAATGFAHDMTKIEGHSCGKYKDKAEEEALSARESLKRYMHYYERYACPLQYNYYAYSLSFSLSLPPPLSLLQKMASTQPVERI